MPLQTDGAVSQQTWSAQPCVKLTLIPLSSLKAPQLPTKFVPCGIRTDGTVTCWDNSYTPPTGTFTAISVGFDLVCAVATSGTMACWTFPCLDAGPVTPPPGPYVSVSVGARIGCGVKTDGNIACWGIGGPSCGY
jgi:hypothetical protein